jgi:hypothetical protein
VIDNGVKAKPEESRKRRWSEVRDADEELQALAPETGTPEGEARYQAIRMKKLWEWSREHGEEDEEEDEESSQVDQARIPDVTLKVKIGTILIVIETIKDVSGSNSFHGPLYNGIRLQVLSAEPHQMRCRVLNMKGHDGLVIWLKRKWFKVRRETRTHPPQWMLQFPVRHAFAMTINKAQVGIFRRKGWWNGAISGSNAPADWHPLGRRSMFRPRPALHGHVARKRGRLHSHFQRLGGGVRQERGGGGGTSLSNLFVADHVSDKRPHKQINVLLFPQAGQHSRI